MIPSGLTSSVINRASLGDAYVRVRDSGLVAAVAQFLYEPLCSTSGGSTKRRSADADMLASCRDGGAWREGAFIACVAV
jgi:hypothetical protein